MGDVAAGAVVVAGGGAAASVVVVAYGVTEVAFVVAVAVVERQRLQEAAVGAGLVEAGAE